MAGAGQRVLDECQRRSDTQASVHLDPQGHIERFSGYVDGLLSRFFRQTSG